MMKLVTMLMILFIPSAIYSQENPCIGTMAETKARLGDPQNVEQGPQSGYANTITWQWPEKNIEATFMWYENKQECLYGENAIVKPEYQAYQNEPDGFRGMKWGMNIKTVKGLSLIKTDGNEKWYKKKKEDLKIGGASLTSIYYVFENSLLASVMILAKGHNNAEALEAATIERFGTGWRESSYSKGQKWDGPFTRIVFEIDYSGDAHLIMVSKEHLKKKWENDEQEAKKGAEKGF